MHGILGNLVLRKQPLLARKFIELAQCGQVLQRAKAEYFQKATGRPVDHRLPWNVAMARDPDQLSVE